jgi:hypothetical protein
VELRPGKRGQHLCLYVAAAIRCLKGGEEQVSRQTACRETEIEVLFLVYSFG